MARAYVYFLSNCFSQILYHSAFIPEMYDSISYTMLVYFVELYLECLTIFIIINLMFESLLESLKWEPPNLTSIQSLTWQNHLVVGF